MSIPIKDDAKRILMNRMKKHSSVLDFFQSGIQGLSTEFNKTIDFLIGSEGPKSFMITKEIVDHQNIKIEASKDILS